MSKWPLRDEMLPKASPHDLLEEPHEVAAVEKPPLAQHTARTKHTKLPFPFLTQVVARCRPLSDQEINDGRSNVVDVLPPSTLKVYPDKNFFVDHAFGAYSEQVEVFELAAKPIVDAVLDGYNGENGCVPWREGGSQGEGQEPQSVARGSGCSRRQRVILSS